jgi:hypothetical protein
MTDTPPNPDSPTPRTPGEGDDRASMIPLEPVDEHELEDDADEVMPPGDLNVCPNCTAPMPDPAQLVCLRCGFDLKSLRVLKTEKRVDHVDHVDHVEADTDSAEGLAVDILRPQIPDNWLPMTIAGAALLILIVALLAGWPGLFPEVQQASELTRSSLNDAARERYVMPAVGWGVRGMHVLQLVIGVALWVGCAAISLIVTSRLMGVPAGELRRVLWRIVAIVACAHLIMLIDLPHIIEALTELVFGLAVFGLLAMLFFRMRPRDAGTFAGVTLSLYLVMFLGARIVVWMTGG